MKNKNILPRFTADCTGHYIKSGSKKHLVKIAEADSSKHGIIQPQLFNHPPINNSRAPKIKGPSTTNYVCWPGHGCICIGDADCNNMFGKEECGPHSYGGGSGDSAYGYCEQKRA